MHLKTDTSVNSHFAAVPTISRSRNGFSVAEKHCTTMQFDYLYPLWWKTIYPGDTLSITQAIMMRLQTQAQVLYDDLYLDAHCWYVPNRLLQTNWARFQFNAQPAGPSQDNSALTTPNFDLSGLGAGGFASKSLQDYLGLPTKINTSASTRWINNYLGRAYNLIWNENYRDQNLQDAVTVDLDEGPDDVADYVLLQRGKRHDKFTSCLPFQQKGTAVTIPLGSSAPVEATGSFNMASVGGVYGPASVAAAPGAPASEPRLYLDDSVTWPADTDVEYASGLQVNLAGATAATLNQLRQSFAIQQILEADARGGTRDVEAIQHRWGVTVPDFRLQRPEYLGGTTWTFDGHVVPQTSETATTPQANLTQFSQALNKFSINHSFVEHGVVMILVMARSNITYQQGLQRDLSYKTRLDYYQPEFANLGEVAVLNQEIYMDDTDSDDLGTFGFQEYGYELRYGENRVTGEMRSNYATSLDSRHMADDYSSLPTLSSGWIVSQTPISRNIVIATDVADPIQVNQVVSGKIARTLPMYSIPGLTRL